MIPGKYQNIGAAIAFSPTLEGILAEASRIKNIYGATLILMHIGEKTQEKENVLNQHLEQYGIKESIIVWKEGNTVNAILDICKEKNIDLIIAGALVKETLLKYYIGTVARALIRSANCSVLLIQNPSVRLKPFQKIVINIKENIDNTRLLNIGCYLSGKENVQETFVVKEADLTGFKLMMNEHMNEEDLINLKKQIINDEVQLINTAIEQVDIKDLNIKTKILFGKQGLEASIFSKKHEADLLIIHSPEKHYWLLDRLFQHDLEYILSDLPCNLLMVYP